MAEDTKATSVRVVVVGVGAVTAQGPTATTLWDGVRDGRVEIREVRGIPMDGYRTRIAGEVAEAPEPKHDYPRPEDFRERALDFALVAAEEAFEASGISVGDVAPERWGIVMGTCNAGLLSGERWYMERSAGREPDPSLVPLVPPQALSEAIAAAFDVKGPALSVDTACAAGANAVGYAAELVRSGRVDAAFAGGTDALSDVLIAGFNSLESLSPLPAAPYSKDRLGLSLGEGSGMLILAREDVARRLGAPILAEVVGYGLSADGYHPTAPHPEGLGASRAIRSALAAAGVDADRVGYVNSHGTGTAKNDPAETQATRRGLGDAADRVAVSSTKSMIGHLLGAAGAVEAIVTVRALQDQIAPPTANFTEADPECDLDYVPNVARPLTFDVGVSNNFAFGGANASLVFARENATAAPPPSPAFDRPVVTGVAALTPAGIDPGEALQAVLDGRDCTRVEDGAALGRVDFDPNPFLSRRERRRMDRLGVMAVVSSQLALADGGLEVTDDNRDRTGVIFGTGIGPMEAMEDFAAPLFTDGPSAANAAVFPNTVYNAAGGQVAMRLGAVGPASTVTTGHAAGLSALCYAADLLSHDHADAILCPAADVLTDTVVGAYPSLGAFGNGTAAGDGRFALAEGGSAVLLERAAAARARGARVYGELAGYGIACDAVGVGRWDLDGRGIERAMREALERAGLGAEDIVTVWTGAGGYPRADAPESAALDRIFGTVADAPLRRSPKLLLGDPMGVGGALSTVLACAGWQRGDRVGPALINSSSLGGTHFSAVLVPETT